jgi:hypothetical protein
MGDVIPFRRPSPRPAALRPVPPPSDNPYWLVDALHLHSYDRAMPPPAGTLSRIPDDDH